MKLEHPIAFLTTSDAAASRRFYEHVLGLTCTDDTPFALVFRVGGFMLRIQKVEGMNPSPATVFGFAVDDIHAAVSELASKGVTFERYDHTPQDDQGVWTSPAGARVAWFKDPVGNLLSLTQE